MIRTHSTCKYCPYSTKRKVWSDSPPNAKLLLLGEAPGADEEALGKVFSGASGRLLNWAISQVGLYRPSLWITNVINCRPQKNDISTLEASDAIVACQPGLRQELEAAVAGGVTTILALGATAIKALGIHGAVEKIRGSVYEWKSKSGKIIHVVPTYHPAAIMRQHWKRSGGGTADAGVLWLADFRKAKSISEDGWVTLQEHFNLKPTVTDVEHFVDTALKSNALIAVDTETTGLSLDYAKIVVIGLASGPEDAISVPFLDKDGFNYWTPTEQERVVSALKQLFSTCDQVYQNSFFDVPLLRRHGFPVPWEKISHDTLLLSHTLAAESKHDLGSIVSLYGKTPYWKEEFKNRTVSILKMDQLEMRRYNLRDSVVLHQVLPPMLDELRTLNLVDFYHDEVQPLIAPIMEMLEEGVGFTPSRVATFKRDLEARLTEIDTQLRTDMNLPDSFNLNSDDHLRWFLFGHEPTVFKHLVDLPKKKPGTKIYAELVGIQALKDRGGPMYILAGWHPPSTASGKPSVDAEGLLSFRIQLNNRLQVIKNDEEKSKISKLLAWLDVLDEHTKLTKLLTTYTKYEPMKDGRIHPRWIAHGTVSGRLACIGGDSLITIKGKGQVSIKDYTPVFGDKVLTHTGKWKQIVRKYNQGDQLCVRLTTETDRSIICTTDHRFWTPLGWKEAKDLKEGSEVYCVGINQAEKQSIYNQTGKLSLFRGFKKTHCRANRKRTGGNSCYGNCNHQRYHRPRSSSSRESSSLLQVKNRSKFPNVREMWIKAPELEGSMLRSQRALYDENGGKTVLLSQDCLCRNVGDTSVTTPPKSHSSPHRWRSFQQQFGQSSFSDKIRPQETPQIVEHIADITFMGTLQTFDLEVEEDHSFEANGFLVHNCREPNLMNVPKPTDDPNDFGTRVRGFFTAKPGHKMISCDYVNLEAQLLAFETEDPILCEVFERGLNLHDINTRSMFKISKEDPKWKPARKAAKVFFFGGIAYGGGDLTIYKKVYNEAPDLQLTFADFKKAKDSWMREHPHYVQWKERVLQEVMTKRQLRTEFGRLRQFLGNDKDIGKEALDYKIQSAGASLVNRAMARIYAERNRLGLKARFILQVHDQLVMECPLDEVEVVKSLMVREMEKPFQFKGKTRHIPVECSEGDDFASI